MFILIRWSEIVLVFIEWTKIFINRFALPKAMLNHPPHIIETWDLQNVTFSHDINDIMLIGQDTQEVGDTRGSGPYVWIHPVLLSWSHQRSSPPFLSANPFICLLRNLVLLIILSLSYKFNISLPNKSFLSILEALH